MTFALKDKKMANDTKHKQLHLFCISELKS